MNVSGKKTGQSDCLDLPLYLFHQGTNYKSYELLGSHTQGGSTVFRVWAPSAEAVSLVGGFNGWNPTASPMTKISDGVWETSVPGLPRFESYKYAITSKNGQTVLKSDPYATHFETRPGTASKLFDLDGFTWTDKNWLRRRAETDVFLSPMNIYELHAGSWRRYPDGQAFSYRKLAQELVPYVKSMGYTHIELMPLSEYPLDMSWGYQPIGYFAPTSRYGTPHDFCAFVDACHSAGVGVILDWVCAHFPKDECGLYRFDGSPCYEYSDPLMAESPDWGTCYFDCGRAEVQSFLISNAGYWLEKYHLDGLRVDAVSSMLYLDYGRKNWTKNRLGGNINLETVDFFQKLNTYIESAFPGAVMIAEESTSFPKITSGVSDGGLGFSFKWNMGWMHDTLDYMATDPLFRAGHHEKLTFSMTYAHSENHILAISHDEVVHGKKSLLDKMPGGYTEKFANLRLFYAYLAAHPGKKLIFMGCENAPFREWDYSDSLEWFMLDHAAHRSNARFCAALNAFYLSESCLWQLDRGWAGFEWLEPDAKDQNILAFSRFDSEGGSIICTFNFSGGEVLDYPLKNMGRLEGISKAELLFSTDEADHGGFGRTPSLLAGRDGVLLLSLPPLSAAFWRPAPES